MSKMGWWVRLGAICAAALTSSAAWAYTGAKWNLPEGVTEISHEVHGLHMLMFTVCVVIGCVVFGAMFYSIVMHRKSKGYKPADFHESTLVEIIWTGIPFIILIAIAIPAAGTLIKMDDTRNADMSVKITAYQWKWQYDYLGEDLSFFSTLAPESNRARQLNSGIDPNTVANYLVDVDNPLVLPVGRKIRFLVTSNDVIHAWWVSELAVKKDAIPGYINEVWTRIDEPGTYRGVCAELCGRDHGFMPIVVKALPADEYDAWLAGKTGAAIEVASSDDTAGMMSDATPADDASTDEPTADAPAALSQDELVAAGEKVYAANCAACHQPAGTGMPPTFPSLIGSAVVSGPVDAQISQVLNGKNVMPPFGHLSDEEVAAVVTYTRNSWGNSSGTAQPAAVVALR